MKNQPIWGIPRGLAYDNPPGGSFHPWAGEDLSLKIDERDQTIWICILEL